MMKYYIGLDSGSTMCKVVLLDDEKIVDCHSVKTGWNPKHTAEDVLETLLKRNELNRDDVCIASTGYGREAIDCAHHSFTEITCHAYGGMLLAPDIQGVIDIGGQDSKVIQIQDGKVANFLMNDKCAAGTGRFLSMACDTLEIALDEIDQFADISNIIPINSMCAVFAESEIIGLKSMQKDRSHIMSGVLESIAQRIQQMTVKLDFDWTPDPRTAMCKPLLMTGGLSKSSVLMKMLSKAIGMDVISHDLAPYAGAIGACVCALKKTSR